MAEIAMNEFVAARDAARGFSGLVKSLASGERAKVVVLHRNRPAVVMVSWASYQQLMDRRGR